jgi:hypothetical protein
MQVDPRKPLQPLHSRGQTVATLARFSQRLHIPQASLPLEVASENWTKLQRCNRFYGLSARACAHEWV